jgi:hypothetical protein
MARPRRFLVSLCSFFLLTIAVCQAELPSGTIAGTITDPSNAAVAGAQVTLKNTATGESRSTTTSSTGGYEFPLVRPATYQLSVAAKGFTTAIQKEIAVNVGVVVHLDIKLKVGVATETVEVSGTVQLIEPERTSISSVIDSRRIQNLPLLGRQFLDLALVTPGATPQAPGTQAGGFQVAGMRSQSNNFTLDGVSNNDPQVNGPLNNFRIADAVQEFNVSTSIASTDVGRNSGAQVSIITKSGTNSYHGTLFYSGRNEALDANDFFLNRAGQPKNGLRRHQFGGTVGGWIRRDRTFWFFSFEGFRQKFQNPQTALVPSLLQRAAVVDPVSVKLLAFIPPPNTPLVGGTNWAGVVPETNYNESYLLRVDQKLTSNHQLMGRGTVFLGRTNTLQTNPFHGNITNWPSSHSYVVQEVYAKPRLVNEFRLGFSRNHTFFRAADNPVNPATIFTDALNNPLPGYVNTATDPRGNLNGGLPRITITGFRNFGLGAGTNMPQGRATNTYQLIDNVTLVRGRHTLKFGGEIRREITNRFLNGNFRGSISFSNFSRFAGTCGTACTGGIAKARTGSLRTGLADQTFRNWFRTAWYMYFLDSIKVKSNLTVNLGLRYELPGTLHEVLNRGSNFVPGVGMVVLGSNNVIGIDPVLLGRNAILLTPGPTTLPDTGQFGPDRNNFAPSVGIAWAPKIWPRIFGDGKTVIRTGFRLSYDDIFANIPVNMGLNGPRLLSTSLVPNTGNLITSGYTWGQVLSQNRRLWTPDPTVAGGERGIVTFNAWDTNPQTAYAMNYALEVEREFGRDYAVEFSYVGSQGRQLGVFTDPNQPFVTVVNPAVRGDLLPNTRTFPFRQYGGIGLGTFGSNSNYNGLVARVRKKQSHGLTFDASYSFGRVFDDNSAFFGSDADSGSYADTRNRIAEYGPAAFDIRHRIAVTYIYELPFGRGKWLGHDAPGWENQIIGGWQVSGVTAWQTGFPLTLHANHSLDFSGFNQFNDRPNLVPGGMVVTDMNNPDAAITCSVPGPALTNCFTNPGAGNIGNVPRNSIHGPRFAEWDIGIYKSFPIPEGRRLQYRAELFNAFNQTRFNLPEHNLNVGGVGTISSAQFPRVIQMSLRFEW